MRPSARTPPVTSRPAPHQNARRARAAGPLPPALGSLPSLVVLDARNNSLGGPLGPLAGALAGANEGGRGRLVFLNLANNALEGPLPEAFAASAIFDGGAPVTINGCGGTGGGGGACLACTRQRPARRYAGGCCSQRCERGVRPSACLPAHSMPPAPILWRAASPRAVCLT